MKNINLILIIFLIPIVLLAGNENTPIGGRSSGMGNASVALSDYWSAHNNQAGLSRLKGIGVGFYYDNRFMLTNTGMKSLAFVLPVKSGVFGLSASNYGYELYNETKAGLSFSKSFGPVFSAGVQLDYLRTSLGDIYGSNNTFTFEIGVQAIIMDGVTLGAHIFNPIEATLNDYNKEKIPSVIRLGLAYQLNDNAIFSIEGEKDSYSKPVFRGGFEYLLVKQLFLRAGIETNPNTGNMSNSPKFCFGFGVNLAQFRLDFASSVHTTLGYSPQVSILYSFK